MRGLTFLVLLAPLFLGGCFSSTASTPASRPTTVVVPQGQGPVVICPNGQPAPC